MEGKTLAKTVQAKVDGLINALETRKEKHLIKNNLNPDKEAIAKELDDVIELVRQTFPA